MLSLLEAMNPTYNFTPTECDLSLILVPKFHIVKRRQNGSLKP